MTDLADMQAALLSYSKQLAILQSYLSLKFGLEFQEFYDRSLRILPGMATGPIGDVPGDNGGCRGDRGEQSRGFPHPQRSVPPSRPMESGQEMRGRNQTPGNEEPHSTMEVDEGKEGVADESCLKTEVEEGSPFVCVKNEDEEEEDKIIPDFEDEDPLMFSPTNVSLTVRSEAEIDEEEIVDETSTTDLEDPLAIVDYDKEGPSSEADVRSSKGKGIQHHRMTSSDEEYQEEDADANSSSEDEDDPIRATAVGESKDLKDGGHPVRRGPGRPRKVKEKEKVKKKRGRKPTINVHRPPPQPLMPRFVRPAQVRNLGNIKSMNRKDICSYCSKSLTGEEISEYEEQEQNKDEKEGAASSRPVCKDCAKVYQSTAEKIKNLWSSIIPSAKGPPSSKS